MKATIDEEYVLKLSGLRMIFRIIAIVFVVAMTPLVIKGIHRFYERRDGQCSDSFVVEEQFRDYEAKTDNKLQQEIVDRSWIRI